MKFGLMFTNTGMGSTAAGARELATVAEQSGFESLWAVEHVVIPSGYESSYPYDRSGKMAGGAEEFDLPDPLIWLAYVAAVTETIKLATGILILPQRNPLVTAKEVASIDALSGGRMILGVGVGSTRSAFRSPIADVVTTTTSRRCAPCGATTRHRCTTRTRRSTTASVDPVRRTARCRL
jgi:alkanesulfonate monooxygenase SsuD/methylene tetrahydromethanopterin reductase-like flavin-dependent oxidoreductase (luciferase family)